MDKVKCPACGRRVYVTRGVGQQLLFCTHGPGPNGEFSCPGSGQSASGKVVAAGGPQSPGSEEARD